MARDGFAAVLSGNSKGSTLKRWYVILTYYEAINVGLNVGLNVGRVWKDIFLFGLSSDVRHRMKENLEFG